MQRPEPPGAPAGPASASPGVHAQRVIFIDLARALAVLFMLYGHAASALLAPEFRRGLWFDLWQFQRGLTASLFLLLSGFAFSVATARRWPLHVRPSAAVWRRTRRFVLFAVLGYALHFPVSRFAHLAFAGEERWRSFLAVDVLQLIGATFLVVQALVLVTRVRWLFTVTALAAAAVVAAATPWMWSVEWTRHLPLWAASYLSPASGSQFPIFPWAAYVLLGAAVGQAFGQAAAGRLAHYANAVLLLPGAGLVAAGVLLRPAADTLFTGAFASIPPEVLVRAGACLCIVSGMAHLSRLITRLPHMFGAVAQETLLIYFVHLCIVYGSVWNTGLAQIYGEQLAPLHVVAVVAALIAAMTVLAWRWNAIKHRSPRAARWIAVGAAAALVAPLV